MTRTILVADDEPKIARVLRGYLEQAGFRVVTAEDGPLAVAVFRSERPDLILLDLMLPGMDGLDVCRAIRRDSDVPIIMLTARAEESDKLVGLELGADDYVTKPFSPREVVARVRAVLRRGGPGAASPELLRVGPIVVDLAAHQVTVEGQPVELTPTEFELLSALARSPGRTFTRQQLLDQAQGNAYEGYERTVDVHVRNLRSKIEPDPRNPRFIQTVYGVGYRLEVPNDAP